jgi:hypothetical protein
MIDNILTTQAFSIQSNKGVYALFSVPGSRVVQVFIQVGTLFWI